VLEAMITLLIAVVFSQGLFDSFSALAVLFSFPNSWCVVGLPTKHSIYLLFDRAKKPSLRQ
jgi:hypothetical protein